jgi:hypothetical protein
MPTPTFTGDQFEAAILEGRRWLYIRGYLEHATATDADVMQLLERRYPGGWSQHLADVERRQEVEASMISPAELAQGIKEWQESHEATP